MATVVAVGGVCARVVGGVQGWHRGSRGLLNMSIIPKQLEMSITKYKFAKL